VNKFSHAKIEGFHRREEDEKNEWVFDSSNRIVGKLSTWGNNRSVACHHPHHSRSGPLRCVKAFGKTRVSKDVMVWFLARATDSDMTAEKHKQLLQHLPMVEKGLPVPDLCS
jgi:hypothetical protein